MLEGKKVIIGITGGIAAYKIPLLVRLLVKMKATVKIIMTPAAHGFVTPLTLSTLCGHPVLTDPYDKETGAWNSHVDLGKWADLFLIAPLSANTLAKMAHGQSDNLLLTTYLSAQCPVFFAPAMDLDMYKHPTTQQNITLLQQRGNIFIAPATGELASGLCGEGRMKEPAEILEVIKDHFKKKSDFTNKNILITAGPTREPIDPVRYISNYSSGKMGYAIAEAFADRGANVIIISGPVDLAIHNPRINIVPVTTAGEMLDAVNNLSDNIDVFVMTAAVSDYRPAVVAKQKIKKEDAGEVVLSLKKNKDILAHIGKNKTSKQLVIGFALETENEIDNAIRKLENKNADLIVLNSLNDPGAGFGADTNKISIIDKNGRVKRFSLKGKKEVAQDIVDTVKKIIL
ncbi:MAG: bifunctional phosphopantothenoylcysteine decarboxylase/phosphopantothenate--cysteine ligase CoaBC [Bacteroidales bacterium]|nr:bifunctional phosphopantothenoylcysteine decarboxylase/phosphopantothenate--cysteine ligase CoaBC [Bacteroidales bacterium]